MGTDPQPPSHDPWLVHLDRWTLRILKLGCFTCVLIFVVKVVLHELGHGPQNRPQHRPDHPAAAQP